MVADAAKGTEGGSSPQQGGHTSLGGWGVLLRRWSVFYEGLRGVAAPNGPGTSA